MLEEIPFSTFREWKIYASLEPFGGIRGDYQAAHIASTLANIYRNREKRPEPFTIEEYLLPFDMPRKPVEQTWQQQKALMKAMFPPSEQT